MFRHRRGHTAELHLRGPGEGLWRQSLLTPGPGEGVVLAVLSVSVWRPPHQSAREYKMLAGVSYVPRAQGSLSPEISAASSFRAEGPSAWAAEPLRNTGILNLRV